MSRAFIPNRAYLPGTCEDFIFEAAYLFSGMSSYNFSAVFRASIAVGKNEEMRVVLVADVEASMYFFHQLNKQEGPSARPGLSAPSGRPSNVINVAPASTRAQAQCRGLRRVVSLEEAGLRRELLARKLSEA